MNNKIFTILFAILLIGFYSCQKDKENKPLSNEEVEMKSTDADKTDGFTVLGEQLENPYSIESMNKAYENLKNSGIYTPPDFCIEKTHLYLRFLPRDEKEFELLKESMTLDLYDIPLDYEILVEGNFYHDKSLPDSSITWQYCAIEVDKYTDLPNIHVEILADLYIPPIDKDEVIQDKELLEFYEILQYEALRITNNLDEEEEIEIDLKNKKSTNGWGLPSKWRPSGRIRVERDKNSNVFVPIEGVVVRARRFYTTYKGTTDANGYFSCDGKFRWKAKYIIKWEKYDFSIRRWRIEQAKTKSHKKRGSWNKNITGGRDGYYATIFRAAYYYYHKPIYGLHG